MNRLILLLALGLVVFTGCTVQSPNPNNGNGVSVAPTYPEELFDLEAAYTGAGSWDYSVTADMPTPCHGFSVQAFVAESYPEQVTIEVVVSEPAAGIVCAQVIDTQTVAGSFVASELATVNLRVR